MNKFLNVALIMVFCILGAKYADEKLDKSNNLKIDRTDKTVYIYGIGVYSDRDLRTVENVIESYYGDNCEVVGNKPINKSDFYKHYIDGDKVLKKYNNPKKQQIFVTADQIYSHKFRQEVSGKCSYTNNTMIVSSSTNYGVEKVTKHEYGHRLGLRHCKDKKCIMFHQETDECTGELCQKCKKRINKK